GVCAEMAGPLSERLAVLEHVPGDMTGRLLRVRWLDTLDCIAPPRAHAAIQSGVKPPALHIRVQVSRSVSPGPPAATYPWLAPVFWLLTQNANSRAFFRWNRSRTGLPAAPARSPRFHVTACRVLSARTVTQSAADNPSITLPCSSRTSAVSSPSRASALTNRYLPAKRTGRVVSSPASFPASSDA